MRESNKEWTNLRYNNDYWKSKVFKIENKLYLLEQYSNLYDIVRYKDGQGVKSAKRNVIILEISYNKVNIAITDLNTFKRLANRIERVGTSVNPYIKKSFDGYVDGGLRTMATELEPEYERKRYRYDPSDSGEVLITLNNRKVIVDINNCNFKFYNSTESEGTQYSDVVLGSFLKSYTGNLRVIDTVEVPGRKTISGPYMKKVKQVVYEGTLGNRDLGNDILDKSILDKKVQLISFNNSDPCKNPILEITLK